MKIFFLPEDNGARLTGDGTLAGSVWDEVLNTRHTVVVRTYIELAAQGPGTGEGPDHRGRPDEEARHRCPKCGERGRPAGHDVVRWRTLDVVSVWLAVAVAR